MTTETVPDEWIVQNVAKAIYISSSGNTITIPPSKDLPVRYIDFHLFYADKLITSSSNEDTPRRILDLMLMGNIRRGARGKIEPFLGSILKKIELLVRHELPVTFVLPTLPFKDQSPLTTGLPIDAVDFGEYAFFAQIKRITEAIQEIYEPGAHFTLLCDGYIYADIFANNNVDGAGRYKARCEKIKNEYKLYNEVTLFDMREVLFDLPSWGQTESEIRSSLLRLKDTDPLLNKCIQTLIYSFLYHVSIPYTYEQARNINLRQTFPEDLISLLTEAAIKYICVTLSLKHTNVVSAAFPSAVRCTIHPKEAPQLPLNLVHKDNSILPYNGVATISRRKLQHGVSIFNAIRVRTLDEIYEHDDVVAIHRNDSGEFLYYEMP